MDNTLREEIRGIQIQFGNDWIDADEATDKTLAAIKNRLPKEDDYQSPKWTVPHTAEMMVAYAEGWDTALAQVRANFGIKEAE